MISYLGKLWTKGSGRFVLESTILAIEDDDGPLMSHKSHMNLSLCHLWFHIVRYIPPFSLLIFVLLIPYLSS